MYLSIYVAAVPSKRRQILEVNLSLYLIYDKVVILCLNAPNVEWYLMHRPYFYALQRTFKIRSFYMCIFPEVIYGRYYQFSC